MTVTVKARIDGQLDTVGFTEGQDVKAGQTIARIDPRTLQAQLAQVDAQKARDVAMLGNARADLQRYTTLIAEDAATKQQVDTQKALVAQLEAAVKTDDAQIQFAKVQLSFTNITAPISGRVGARLVDPGNIVHAADTGGLVVINQVDPISVVFTLPEGTFQAVNRALNTSHEPLVVEAYPREGNELLGTGKLILLNNQIDTTTGTVQLKGSFPNPKHTLWPGQFVNVRLVLGTRKQALTIPAAAVQRGQDGTYTYVVDSDGQTVQNRPITVANIQDSVAIIDKGVAAGERVVIDGQYKLKPGSRIVETAKKPVAGASAVVAEADAKSEAGAKK
jgi:membrane fusion protein, multidrug efflux system